MNFLNRQFFQLLIFQGIKKLFADLAQILPVIGLNELELATININ